MAELIVALDYTDPAAAIELLDRLPPGCAVKVGAVMMASAGIGFVRTLVSTGHPVFLDPKWHDIPNTVAGAVRAASALGVDMVTVHALGGSAMMRAAAQAARESVRDGMRPRIVAVTVLTSHDAEDYAGAVGRNAALDNEVVRLASLAINAGLDGLVCAPGDVALLRPIVGGGRIVVPGIRRSADAVGDQHRAGTAGAAVTAGATHVVVGRPITEAADPAAAWREFAAVAG